MKEEMLAYDTFDVISDFGGIIGLLLGASILSSFDYFSAIFKSFTHKCKSLSRTPISHA